MTPNDEGDLDTGPNLLQNFPTLQLVEGRATTRVAGTLNSTANATFTIDFYANAAQDPSGYGEGQRWIGSTTVSTNELGNASFDVPGLASTAPGEFVSATATDVGGNTSEFSGGDGD